MKTITVKTIINSTINRVWHCWTSPEHIVHWNFATDDWQCPVASNDVRKNGRFSWRMEAKNGTMGFDYSGKYEMIEPLKKIKKRLDDGRAVEILFSVHDDGIEVVEIFEPDTNEPELQRLGWQSILNNFKKHVESHA